MYTLRSFTRSLLLPALMLLALISNYWSGTAMAQDTHFSQNYATPLLINPALTGLMAGDLRFNAAYRNQWNSLLPAHPYRTVLASGDAAFGGGVGNNRLGAGITLYNDQSGMVSVGTTYVAASAAYHAALSPQAYLSIGVSGGMMQKRLDLDQAQFGNQYIDNQYNPNAPTGENFARLSLWRPSIGGGALFYYLPNARASVFAGLGMYHFLRANYALTNADGSRDLQKAKLSAQLGASLPIAERWDIVPTAYYIQQQQHYKIDVGTMLRYVFDRNRRYHTEKALSMGAYTRITGGQAAGAVAIIPAAKLDYERVSMGVSYDLTIGSLQAANGGNGAVELSLSYVAPLQQHKRKVVACPRF